MLTALRREVPDRVPATLHQWQPYHLSTYMNGMSDIEAFRAVGLDAAITRSPFTLQESNQWRVSRTREGSSNPRYLYTVETPEGTLSYTVETNEYTAWVSEHLIKNDEDIRLYRNYHPRHILDREAMVKAYDEIGDDGILRMFIIGYQGGCWQDACELHGTENMIYAAMDKPEWVHEFLSILLDEKLSYIEEQMSGVKVDLVETGGGAASTTVISPSMHEEFCVPYDKKMHDALHRLGHSVVYHTCGGMMPLLDIIPENGCDASETLSPPGVGGDVTEPEKIKGSLGNKVSLIGGLDQFNILGTGTHGAIRDEVQRLFTTLGPGGGYIMSAADHFFEAPVENLRAYAAAARECTY
jgi:uroporphyrinogen-III decarboxylase